MPFIASWPGTIPSGVEDSTSVMGAIDISPTLCRLAGVPFEHDLDGIDRSDVLLGDPSTRGKALFWQYGHPHAILKGGKSDHQSPTFAMRDGRWKFLVNPDGSEAQLYDLQADEGERRNLLLELPERATAMAAQVAAFAADVGFEFDQQAELTAPSPTIAILASNQLLRFVNHGVEGEYPSLRLDGGSRLDLPAFRAPKVARGRTLQIKGEILASSPKGVIFAHGDARSGYSVYIDDGHLCFAACANGRRTVVESTGAITGSTRFEANWKSDGDIFLKVDGRLVGKSYAGVMQNEPRESVQIGADFDQAVAEYSTPNYFSGVISGLTFRYPNGN